MIIGVTGTLGAGKGTIVEYLTEKRGCKHYSVSGYLKEKLVERGVEVNRTSLVNLGNELREKFGQGYIVEQLFERARQGGGNAVIESLRNPGEVEILRKKGGFVLLAVDADIGLRYERIRMRGSEKDSVSFEEFCSNEKREMESDDPNKLPRLEDRGTGQAEKFVSRFHPREKSRGILALNKQNLRQCMEMADFRVLNNGSKEKLYSKLEGVLNGIKT